jgi:DHA3 family macrolide efflux protein-like MFS transporter
MISSKVSQQSVWLDVRFLKFFLASTIGNIGDWFDLFALQIIFANELNGSSVDISMLMTVYMLPGLIFGLFAGVLVDRFKKRSLLVLTDLLSGVMTVLVIYSHAIDLILLLIFVRGCLGALNSPAQQAFIKFLVEGKKLMQASALMSISFQISRVIGPFLGAFLLIYFHPQLCLWLNAASFFLSAILIISIHFTENISFHVDRLRFSFFRELRETLHVLLGLKRLLWVILYMLTALLLVMVAESQMVLLLRHFFPNDHAMLGRVMAISAVGSVISGVYLSKKESSHEQILLAVSFLILAFAYLLMGLFRSDWPVLLFYLAAILQGFGLGAILVLYSYIIKQQTPDQHIGKISGFSTMAQGLAFVLGAFLSGYIVLGIGITPTYVLVGGIFLLLVVVVCFKGKVINTAAVNLRT